MNHAYLSEGTSTWRAPSDFREAFPDAQWPDLLPSSREALFAAMMAELLQICTLCGTHTPVAPIHTRNCQPVNPPELIVIVQRAAWPARAAGWWCDFILLHTFSFGIIIIHEYSRVPVQCAVICSANSLAKMLELYASIYGVCVTASLQWQPP